MTTNLKDLEINRLEEFFENLGEKKYRAKQVFKWIYTGADSFEEMSDLPKQLRETLKNLAELMSLKISERFFSQSDGTIKYLFELIDGNLIESVFMKYKFGNSVCVSSQAGCKMGCVFCASGKDGFIRNLSPGEMSDQILKARQDSGQPINHVVVMGTGEPFDNYENLSKFIRIINDKNGLNIGMRNITVSTCGIIPKIKNFAADFPQANLAISLHAPNAKLREKIMPIETKYGFEELISACEEYTKTTGRKITFEYALIDGINDSASDAELLSRRLRGMLCHINLIPLNFVAELSNGDSAQAYAPSTKEKTRLFLKTLQEKGASATIRRELGADINAACGQLRLGRSPF